MIALARRRVAASLLVLAMAVVACGGGDPAVVSTATPEALAVRTAPATPATAPTPAAAPEDPTAQLPVVPPDGQAPGTAPPVAPGVDGTAAGSLAPVLVPGDVEATLAGMTLEQKVGQLFAVSVVGDDATEPSEAARRANTSLYGVPTPAEVVAAYHLGGVAYLAHDLGPGTSNVADVPGVLDLSLGLQRAAAADTGIGLLVGADQEGGRVVRLRAPATVFPAAREIGDIGDIGLAQEVGRVTGAEALALGINWVFAPVADVNVNPANPVIGDRAFGTTVAVVSPFAEATAAGIRAAGALPTLKHFPGHGDTTIDSHSSLPAIDHDLGELSAIDLPPFRSAAAAPLRTSVMIGHLAVPALDPSGTPATLSRPIIDVLREELGFSGLVVTDAMNMGALSGFGDQGSLAVQAIAAGIDVVLMPSDLPAAYGAVLAAATAGTLSEATIDAAVRRVLATKDALGILDARSTTGYGPASVAGGPDGTAVRDRVRAACSC